MNWLHWCPDWPAEVLRLVKIDAVHDYLTARGWVQKMVPRDTTRYYEHSTERLADEDHPLYLFFPASDEWPSYPDSVISFLRSMATLEDIRPSVVFHRLTGLTPDEAAASVAAVSR